jgi:hypothetical protein
MLDNVRCDNVVDIASLYCISKRILSPDCIYLNHPIDVDEWVVFISFAKRIRVRVIDIDDLALFAPKKWTAKSSNFYPNPGRQVEPTQEFCATLVNVIRSFLTIMCL